MKKLAFSCFFMLFSMKIICFSLLFNARFWRINRNITENAHVPACFAWHFGPKFHLLDENAKLILTYCISIAFSIEMSIKKWFGRFFGEKCSFGRGAFLCPAPWILQILALLPLANHPIYSTGQHISKHECVWWHTAVKLSVWKSHSWCSGFVRGFWNDFFI